MPGFQFHLLSTATGGGQKASPCVKCGATLDHSFTEHYTLNEQTWAKHSQRCVETRRCAAWSYPGYTSWEGCQLSSVKDGRQCALDAGHVGAHELTGPWTSPRLRDELGDLVVLAKPEAVDHPAHYGGKDNPYETIKVIETWQLDFCLGNAVKYISRAGKKDPAKEIEDLEKGAWYLQRAIEFRKAQRK